MIIYKWSQFLTAKIKGLKVGGVESDDIERFIRSKRSQRDIKDFEDSFYLSYIEYYTTEYEMDIAGFNIDKEYWECTLSKEVVFFTKGTPIEEIISHYKFL